MHTFTGRLARTLLAILLLSLGASAVQAQQNPPPPPQAATQTLTQQQRALYVGVYEVSTPDGPMRIHIFEDGERLMGRPENEEEPSPLIPAGEHQFRPELAYEALITFNVENGRANRFSIVFPDERGTMVATRTAAAQ